MSRTFLFAPKTFISSGGQKNVYYTDHHEKTTFPIQDILGVIFYIWGHSFQFGAFGKNLKSIFQEQILFFGGDF